MKKIKEGLSNLFKKTRKLVLPASN